MSNFQVDICHVQTSSLKALSAKETLELLKQYQETKDENIKETLVMGNLKLVLSLVSRYKQDELDDLFQVGCIGLVKAIEQFDLSQNVMFSTYAVPLIVGEIKAHLRSRSLLHVSRYLRDLSYKIASAKENYQQTYHQEMPSSELIKQLNIREFDLYQVENLKVKPTSLSEPKSGQENMMIGELIEDEKLSIHHTHQSLCLQEAMNSLNPKEQWLINERYFKDKTQAEIASELYLSQAQVSRMEKKILQQLKDFFI